MLAYSQLISLRPIHILKLIVYFLVEMVSKQITKAYHRVKILAKSTAKDLSEKATRSHEILCLSSPFTCHLRNIKKSFITKKNTIFTQVSTPVGVNVIALSKHRPESSLAHPY